MQKHFCTGKRPAITPDVECFDAEIFNSEETMVWKMSQPCGKTPMEFVLIT